MGSRLWGKSENTLKIPKIHFRNGARIFVSVSILGDICTIEFLTIPFILLMRTFYSFMTALCGVVPYSFCYQKEHSHGFGF